MKAGKYPCLCTVRNKTKLAGEPWKGNFMVLGGDLQFNNIHVCLDLIVSYNFISPSSKGSTQESRDDGTEVTLITWMFTVTGTPDRKQGAAGWTPAPGIEYTVEVHGLPAAWGTAAILNHREPDRLK